MSDDPQGEVELVEISAKRLREIDDAVMQWRAGDMSDMEVQSEVAANEIECLVALALRPSAGAGEIEALLELAETRNDERTSLAGIDVMDERARIPMEPAIVTRLCRSLRASLTAPAPGVREAMEECAKLCDQDAAYWRTADPKKEPWSPEQMTMRLTEAEWLAAKIRARLSSLPAAGKTRGTE